MRRLSSERAAWMPGRVDEDRLAGGRGADADDAGPRGLRLRGDDGHLRADECIQQRRLADVRPPDDGDGARAVSHQPSPRPGARPAPRVVIPRAPRTSRPGPRAPPSRPPARRSSCCDPRPGRSAGPRCSAPRRSAWRDRGRSPRPAGRPASRGRAAGSAPGGASCSRAGRRTPRVVRSAAKCDSTTRRAAS